MKIFPLSCILLSVFFLSHPLLPSTSEFPMLQSLVYHPYHWDQSLNPGQWQGGAAWSYSNMYMDDNRLPARHDLEYLGTTLQVRYGLSARHTLEMSLRTSLIYGGIMDGFIEGFHRAFGFPNGGREESEKYAVQYIYRDIIRRDRPAYYLHSPVISCLSRIYTISGFSARLRTALGLPLFARRGLNSGSGFFTSGFLLEYAGSGFRISGSLYGSWIRRPSHWITETRSFIPSVILKGGVGPWHIGWSLQKSPFRFGDMANRSMLIHAGIQLTRRLVFRFYEEIPPADTVPDFTFELSLTL